MKKLSLVLIISLFTLVIASTADAKNDKKFAPLSEEAVENGTYDVEGHPDMKVKVFVYHGKPDEKPGKPAPVEPTLVCGLSDPDSESVVSNFKISLPSEWQYRLNQKSAPALIGSVSLETIAQNAFNVWKAAIGSTVTFTKGSDTAINRAQLDGQNIVSWGRASGSALAVSYLWYYSDTGKMAEVDTIMNNRFSWKWSDPSSWSDGQACAYQEVYDAQDILTHEFGHTMGLNDHYEISYANNTMYGYGSKGEMKKDTLTAGDIAGVGAIYK